jgi:hypothetical protein
MTSTEIRSPKSCHADRAEELSASPRPHSPHAAAGPDCDLPHLGQPTAAIKFVRQDSRRANSSIATCRSSDNWPDWGRGVGVWCVECSRIGLAGWVGSLRGMDSVPGRKIFTSSQ